MGHCAAVSEVRMPLSDEASRTTAAAAAAEELASLQGTASPDTVALLTSFNVTKMAPACAECLITPNARSPDNVITPNCSASPPFKGPVKVEAASQPLFRYPLAAEAKAVTGSSSVAHNLASCALSCGTASILTKELVQIDVCTSGTQAASANNSVVHTGASPMLECFSTSSPSKLLLTNNASTVQSTLNGSSEACSSSVCSSIIHYSINSLSDPASPSPAISSTILASSPKVADVHASRTNVNEALSSSLSTSTFVTASLSSSPILVTSLVPNPAVNASSSPSSTLVESSPSAWSPPIAPSLTNKSHACNSQLLCSSSTSVAIASNDNLPKASESSLSSLCTRPVAAPTSNVAGRQHNQSINLHTSHCSAVPLQRFARRPSSEAPLAIINSNEYPNVTPAPPSTVTPLQRFPSHPAAETPLKASDDLNANVACHLSTIPPPLPSTVPFHRYPSHPSTDSPPSSSDTSPSSASLPSPAVPALRLEDSRPLSPALLSDISADPPVAIQDSASWEDLVFRVCASLPARVRGPWYNSHLSITQDGPLPLTWRLYIALIAVCRHEAPYAVVLLARSFLQNGGDRRWLLHHAHAPHKLQQLHTVNTTLAHQPWTLTKHHIQALCGQRHGRSTWSASEAMHALLLLSHHHALAALLLCCPFVCSHATPLHAPLSTASPKRPTADVDDLEFDSDEEDDALYNNVDNFLEGNDAFSHSGGGSNSSSTGTSPDKPSCFPLPCPDTDTIASRTPAAVEATNANGPEDLAHVGAEAARVGMPDGAPNSAVGNRSPAATPVPPDAAPLVSKKIPRFESETRVASRPSSPVLPSSGLSQSPLKPSPVSSAIVQKRKVGRSVRSSTVLPGLQPADDCGYKHFPHHLPDEESPKIRSTLFRWIDYGFDTTRRFLGEAVTAALDERFCAATSLSHCLDARGTAVQPPRHRNGACHKPVWRQVQWMCGVLYDDYDYKLLRKTMPLHLQKLIRTATCFPHRLCSVRRSPLSMQDVQLVCSQIMDCRMQCEVLFAVRAMLDYCSMVRH